MKKLFFAFLLSFAAAPASAQYYPGQSLKAHAHTSATDGGVVNNFVAVITSSAPIVRASNYFQGNYVQISSKTTSMLDSSNAFIGHYGSGIHVLARDNTSAGTYAFTVNQPVSASKLISVENNGTVYIGAPPSGKNNLTTILGMSHFNTLSSTMIVTGRMEITGTAFINGATISTSAVVDASKLPLAGGTMTGPLLTPGITVTGGGQVTAGSFSGDGSALTNLPLPITSTAAIISTLSGKLEKSGDTMTGSLTLGSSLTVTGNGRINGSFGVGAAPILPLDVQTTTARLQLKSTTGTNAAWLQYYNDGGTSYIGMQGSVGNELIATGGIAHSLAMLASAAPRPIQFATAGTARLNIGTTGGVDVTGSAFSVGGSTLVVSGGKVGIGTTPTVDFHVKGITTTNVKIEGGTSYVSQSFYVSTAKYSKRTEHPLSHWFLS